MTTTTYYSVTLIEPNQSNKHITANEAFETLATAIHDATGSVTLGGDVSGTGSANTVDKIKNVAVSASAPTSGQTLVYNGTAWTPTTQPYDLPVFIPDKPTASMVCVRLAAVRAFSLPSGLTGSVASAGAAATASTVFDVQKNTTSVGSVTFGIGATTGTLAMASGTSFASGDLLRIIAPVSPDATLADISITFLGTRT